MSRPFHVKIRVYDLLPPSRLSWALNTLGTGVYHSSVELPRAEASYTSGTASYHLEIAFGGHDVAQQTGIFTLPAGTAGERMPGLRPYLLIDAGECFGSDWERVFGIQEARPRVLRRKTSSIGEQATLSKQYGEEDSTNTLGGEPYAQPYSQASSSTSRFASTTDTLALDDEDGRNLGSAADDGERLGVVEEGSPLERAWKTVEQMKREAEWTGPSYSLLQRNCNNFTDELVYRLTGRRAPTWINRASWVATSLPCIVPAGWIDEVDEVAPDAPVSQSTRATPPMASRKMVTS